MKVNLGTCESELYPLLSNAGFSELEKWERDRPQKVVKFAKEFTHEFLFDIQPEDVLEVARHTEHALGNVRKSEVLTEIEDYSAPFAFQDIFHACLEEKRAIPIWSEFRNWVAKERPDLFADDYLRDINPAARSSEERGKLKRALKWRLGKSYYSSLREIHLLASLRHTFGLDVKYHVLADVRLRVDFWMGKHIIVCYFSNPRYRDGSQGRKPMAQEYFQEGAAVFHKVSMDKTREFGKVWLVDDVEIQRIATSLSNVY